MRCPMSEFRCGDRSCGALDCGSCYPDNRPEPADDVCDEVAEPTSYPQPIDPFEPLELPPPPVPKPRRRPFVPETL